ncbi:hypothetical protein RRG08_067222 [Elysia crispata]|uniref:Uncharacterized protein n=1 Tax=Elysia crispata TaxID=231223 RepID=A0AAE1DV53_9GAST|nr:hypothetical protein RRG08_067222 [Elysia crispata]
MSPETTETSGHPTRPVPDIVISPGPIHKERKFLLPGCHGFTPSNYRSRFRRYFLIAAGQAGHDYGTGRPNLYGQENGCPRNARDRHNTPGTGDL